MLGQRKRSSALVASVLAASCLASPASAATFLFTFDGTTVDASGTLTTQDVPSPEGGLLITAITGTFGGSTITGLLPPGSFGGNDNLLFPNDARLLSFGGLTFNFFAGATQPANIFASTALAGGFGLIVPGEAIVPGTFTITAVTNPPVGAIPEPGTWALMLLGFAFVGAAMRRQPRATVQISYG